MKIKITNRKLWSKFYKMFTVIALLTSFLLTFFDLTQRVRIKILKYVIIVSIIYFIILWIVANKKKKGRLEINGTEVNVFLGDIFQQKGIKVIAFNEFFDTQVDGKIISKNTLNGRYLENCVLDITRLNNEIKKSKLVKEKIVEKHAKRRLGGKKTRYQIGTIYPNNDFFLLAFSHFNEQDKAFLTLEEYIVALMRMWNEIDIYYGGNTVNIPLLGNGLTRFKDGFVSPQELLQYILLTFRASKACVGGTHINIVLSEKERDKINIYEIT